MNKELLKNYIDKVQSITVKSTKQDAADALHMYQQFCWTLNKEWNRKYNEYFAKLKKIAPEKWGEAAPNDGFFIHLLYGVLHTQDLCNHDTGCIDEQEKKRIKTIELVQKSLNESLENIKKEYCNNEKKNDKKR